MAGIYDNNSLSVGKTPLIRINNITQGSVATILAKVEGRNPAGSVKCRVAVSMICDAEKNGILVPGNKNITLVEPTSGNTGIGLAFACASRGYPIILTMPETMSIERRRILAAFGAQIILTEGAKGMKGAIDKAAEIVASDPEKYFSPQQFNNPANPDAHFTTTGPEIFEATGGKVDILVAGVGTGGTITGISRYFKEFRSHKLHSVAVEPKNSAVLTAIKSGNTPIPAAHKIQGIGAGFKPEILDLSLIDTIETVTDDEAFEYARLLPRKEGLICGISSGAAMCVASRLAQRNENAGKTIVVILPDTGERYLSTPLFD